MLQTTYVASSFPFPLTFPSTSTSDFQLSIVVMRVEARVMSTLSVILSISCSSHSTHTTSHALRWMPAGGD